MQRIIPFEGKAKKEEEKELLRMVAHMNRQRKRLLQLVAHMNR